MQNLKLPTLIKAKYKIITPMFIGDAEQNATRIAPQSVKGALRFWWRALVWDQIIQAEQDEVKALNELHHQEALLFGSTAINKRSKNKEEYGKGLVAIRVKQEIGNSISNWPSGGVDGSSYLAYGLTGDKQNSHRSAINKGTFEVLLSYQDLSSKQQEQILNALKAFGLFGGLGSRARRALGSVQLVNLNGEAVEIKDRADHLAKAKAILDLCKTDKLASFSAFSNQSRVAINSNLFNDGNTAHSNLGAQYKKYRSEMPNAKSGINKVFGLPLKATDETVRRGSPTLFHVSEYKSGKFAYSVLFLKTSVFSANLNHQKVNYEIIDRFLDSIGGKA